MKNILKCLGMTLVGFVISLHAWSNDPKMPVEVKKYLSKNYPTAKGVHCEKHENIYNVTLTKDGLQVYLFLNEKGELQERVVEISTYNEIPATVTSKVDMKKINYAEKLETATGKEYYILEVKLPKNKIKEMVFDKHGKEVKEITIDQEQEKAEHQEIRTY